MGKKKKTKMNGTYFIFFGRQGELKSRGFASVPKKSSHGKKLGLLQYSGCVVCVFEVHLAEVQIEISAN